MADRAQIELNPAEDEASAATAKSGGGIKAMLPLIITVVLMPAVAWAMTTFVLVPKLQKSLGLTPAEHAEPAEGEGEQGGHEKTASAGEHGGKESGGKEKGGSKETATMAKLLVNVSGTAGSRYLLASLTLAGNTSDFKAKLEKNDAKLRDIACTLLATKNISDLEKPGARNLVRSELLTAFNNVLGGNIVQEIYITEFAIQ
ncbi:MAG TPA: flagellar basal body-associated FliL family protein [Candidatus Limnocylindria bacterium]|nr:flagellar basal body-associated FliL family protein [Candidatus Limnocylindria bacterium]